VITKPTVLVLGAGASVDYGYPSGKALKQQVINAIGDALTPEHGRLVELGHDREQIESFREALRYSGKPSVDAFLEYRSEYVDIGKKAMAQVLIRHESKPSLFSANSDWYEYLYGRLGAPFDRFHLNTLSVVTFNYDRSLEAFLFEALRNSYGKASAEVALMLRAIEIVHVHGQLGSLPWDEKPGRDYTPTQDPREIRIAAQGIRVIHEGQRNDGVFARATALIRSAERVIFLGFGYHDANLMRLNLKLDNEHQEILGTCYGFTERERSEIDGKFKPRGIQLGRIHWPVLSFLREMITL